MIKDYKLKFLKNLIKETSNRELHCFYLGRKSGINYKSNSDIDLYINYKKNSELLLIIKNVCKKFDYKICNILQHEINSFYIVISINHRDTIYFIAIDICNNYFFNNRLLLDFSKNIRLEKKNYSKNKINFFSNFMSFKYYFLKKLMKNDLDKKNLKFLKKLYLSDKDKINFFLKSIFEIETTKNIIKAILNLNYFFIEKKIFFLQNKIKNKYKVTFLVYLSNFRRILLRSINSTGLDISLLGVDGAGKTSILKELSRDFKLNKDGFGFIFRNLNTFHLSFLNNNKSKKSIKNPHKKSEYNIFVSYIKLVYLTLKEIIEIIYCRFLKIKSNLIIYDRTFMDVSIDPKRYRIKYNKIILSIFKFLGNFFLKQINFVIMDDPKNIYNRSKELNLLILKNLLKKYASIKDKKKSIFIIFNKKNKLPFTVLELKKKIIDYQHKKFIKFIDNHT